MNLRLLTLVVGLCLFITIVESGNNYPIVLMHGFLGWGRDELGGFKYWGGLTDLQEDLKSKGYTVFTTAVGPVSSSWDRACEAFAEIKGGQVDYGYVHSVQNGHLRFGRTYTGLYPQWGTTVNGAVQKVHLVCHSQGGQDARLLTYLLNSGKTEEKNGQIPSGQPGVSTLFLGNHPWIASVTTLASPNDGTTLATGVGQFFPFVKNLVAFFASLAGSTREHFYDFKLDQWNLLRDPNESLDSYTTRVVSSSIWTNNKDISIWSLSPDGAKELNTLHGSCDPNVFYLSYTTEDTYQPYFWSQSRYPLPDMFAVLWPFATFMGAYTRSATSTQVGITSSWFKNDGVVNSVSQAGPSIGCTIRKFSSSNSIGVGIFNDMGVKQSWDHLDINGLSTDPLKYLTNDFTKFYIALAATLISLPVINNQASGGAVEVNVTTTLPELTTAQTTNSFNITSLTCGEAQDVYNSMCVNSTSIITNYTFSPDDCATIDINVQQCALELAGGAGIQAPLSWSIIMIVAFFVHW